MEITAFAPPSEAHARIAYALTEVRKYLIPDSNDEIRQEQMREMELLSNVAAVQSGSDGESPTGEGDDLMMGGGRLIGRESSLSPSSHDSGQSQHQNIDSEASESPNSGFGAPSTNQGIAMRLASAAPSSQGSQTNTKRSRQMIQSHLMSGKPILPQFRGKAAVRQ